MGQISESQKTNLQKVFAGMLGYISKLDLPEEYRKDIKDFLSDVWQIVKDYGTVESTRADTKESDDYWTKFVEDWTKTLDKPQYTKWSRNTQFDFIRLFSGFVIDLFQITGRYKS